MDGHPGSHRGVRGIALAAVTAAAGVVAFSLAPISQPAWYHRFADGRTGLGVPNFQNVASNAPFLVVGLVGLATIRRPASVRLPMRRAWAVFFAAVACVALGSGWYHLDPTNQSLFWDRFPMAVAFGAFCAAVVGERLSPTAGRRMLWPLVVAFAATVVYWRLTEDAGRGDLRPYVLAQALPGLWIVVLVAPRPRRDDGTLDLASLLAWYAAAKLLETFDVEVFRATGGAVSGHALKHLAAAAGAAQIVVMLRRRVVPR